MFEYNALHIAPWGHELVIYFTLIGTVAMAYILLSLPMLTNVGEDTIRPLEKPGYSLIMLGLIVCAGWLVFDLGQPQRFMNILIYAHWTSPLVWGGFLLALFGLCLTYMLYAVFIKHDDNMKRWAALVGSIVAVGFPLYTGADLSANQGRAFWHAPMMSVYLTALSATSGVAAISVLAFLFGQSKNQKLFDMLWRITSWSLIVSIVCFGLLTVRLLYGNAEEMVVLAWINSEAWTTYWIVGLVVGLLIPMALITRRSSFSHKPVVIALAGGLGFIGAYAIREVIMLGGQMPQLYY